MAPFHDRERIPVPPALDAPVRPESAIRGQTPDAAAHVEPSDVPSGWIVAGNAASIVFGVFLFAVAWAYGLDGAVATFPGSDTVSDVADDSRLAFVAAITLAGLVAAGIASLLQFRLLSRLQAALRWRRESATRFREYAELASDWLWETDAEDRIVWMSDNVKAATGQPPEWFCGRMREDLAGADLNPGVWEPHRDVLRRREPFRDVLLCCRLPDGNRWLRSSGSPVFDGGVFVGYRGVATDITVQIEAEHRVRDARQLLADAVESLTENFSLWDSEDRLVVCNEGFRAMNGLADGPAGLGVTLEEHLRRCIAAKLIPEAKGREEAWIAERLERRRRLDGPFEQQRAGGIWLQIREYGMSDGGTVMVADDITTRKQSELKLTAANTALERHVAERTKALRESERHLRSIVEYSPLAIMLKDRDGVYRLVNKTFTDGMRVPAERLLGRTPAQVFPAERIESINENDRLVMETAMPLNYDLDLQYADGSVHRFAATKFPVLDDDGAVAGVGLIALDVTEQRRTQEQLMQAQKMEAVGQLTSGLAHDFNNMLGIITGNAELLLEFPEDAGTFVETILRTADRGAALTRQLLVFSRDEPMAVREVVIGREIAEMEVLLRRTLGEQYRIRCRIDPDPWACVVEPAQFESAVINLAINARDAMPEGGEVVIEARNIRIGRNEADGALRPGAYVMLSVSDEGQGIPPGDLDHVFEPFFTTKERGKGTGLGLSMVYGFVRNTGGHATIRSEEGRGTTVRLYLPRATGRLEECVPPRPNVPMGQGEKVLVVEDQDDLRGLTLRNLGALGYTALSAADGFEAEAVLRRESCIDVLLSDVVLPGGRLGPDVAALAQRYHPGLRTVFMSGYTGEALHGCEYLADTEDLLRKPFRKADLARALHRALRG